MPIWIGTSVDLPAEWVPIWAGIRTDTGVGIPKALISRIFDKFSQVDSSSSRTREGIGLGLYIVKKLTDLLGGSIAVETELGKGSRFTVKIPAALSSNCSGRGELLGTHLPFSPQK